MGRTGASAIEPLRGQEPEAMIEAESVKEQVGAKALAALTPAPAEAGGLWSSSRMGSVPWPGR
ncbi:MAG: hypothetical protein KJ015_24015, partial [Myxococcales bacterium]|nr:hypothetical protein [Myxococcales bacterium]